MLFLHQNFLSNVCTDSSDYKIYKGLTKKNQNLRGHMSDLELIFTMLGEINKWHSVAETLLGWLVSKPKKSWVVVLFLLKNFYRIPISRMIL